MSLLSPALLQIWLPPLGPGLLSPGQAPWPLPDVAQPERGDEGRARLFLHPAQQGPLLREPDLCKEGGEVHQGGARSDFMPEIFLFLLLLLLLTLLLLKCFLDAAVVAGKNKQSHQQNFLMILAIIVAMK